MRVFDVGAGASSVAKIPMGDNAGFQYVVTDTGKFNDSLASIEDFIPPGSTIPYVLITHGDLDHIRGATVFADRIFKKVAELTLQYMKKNTKNNALRRHVETVLDGSGNAKNTRLTIEWYKEYRKKLNWLWSSKEDLVQYIKSNMTYQFGVVLRTGAPKSWVDAAYEDQSSPPTKAWLTLEEQVELGHDLGLWFDWSLRDFAQIFYDEIASKMSGSEFGELLKDPNWMQHERFKPMHEYFRRIPPQSANDFVQNYFDYCSPVIDNCSKLYPYPIGHVLKVGPYAGIEIISGFPKALDSWSDLADNEKVNALGLATSVTIFGRTLVNFADAVGAHLNDYAADHPIATEQYILNYILSKPTQSLQGQVTGVFGSHHFTRGGNTVELLDLVYGDTPEVERHAFAQVGGEHDHPQYLAAKRFIEAGVPANNILRTNRGGVQKFDADQPIEKSEWCGGRDHIAEVLFKIRQTHPGQFDENLFSGADPDCLEIRKVLVSLGYNQLGIDDPLNDDTIDIYFEFNEEEPGNFIIDYQSNLDARGVDPTKPFGS